MGLLSPAETHQVIHVKGSGVPHPIAHFPSKAKELAAGLCAQDLRRSRGVHWLGLPRAAFPGRGTAARNRGCWAHRGPRRGHSASSRWDSTQPGRSFWPSLAAHLQREPRFPPEPLCQAQERTKGKSALDLGFAALQGPGRVGWAPAGKERPGEGKADWRVPAVAAASTQPHQHPARPHRLRTLPRAWPFGPYIPAGPEAGRGGAGGTRGGAARGAELLPGRCSSVFLGKTNGEHR